MLKCDFTDGWKMSYDNPPVKMTVVFSVRYVSHQYSDLADWVDVKPSANERC